MKLTENDFKLYRVMLDSIENKAKQIAECFHNKKIENMIAPWIYDSHEFKDDNFILWISAYYECYKRLEWSVKEFCTKEPEELMSLYYERIKQ